MRICLERSDQITDPDAAKPRRARGFAPSLAFRPASPAIAGTHPVPTVIGLGRRCTPRLLLMLCVDKLLANSDAVKCQRLGAVVARGCQSAATREASGTASLR